MTKNEQIASILLEAAELLKNDNEQESLNEDIGLGVIGTFVGLVTVSLIYIKVKAMILKKKMFKNKHSIYDYETNKLLSSNVLEVMKKAKYIKYKKSVKDTLITNIKLSDKLEKLDNELLDIKTVDEYYNKKDKLEKEYDALYYEFTNTLKTSLNKIKNDNEYIENDFSIIPLVEKYLKCGKYRNLDGDDYWESIDFLYDMYKNNEKGKDVDKAFEDAYDTLTTFPEYSIYEITNFLEPLKYITIKVK